MKKRNIKALVNRAIREGGYADMIEKISLFGSCARGEENEESDIDLLVEFTPNAPVSLFDLVDIKEALEKILGRKIDLVTYDGISPYLKDGIISQAKLVYER